MEFGTYTIADTDLTIDLMLYGVPGQSRFRFMWDIVAEGMDALLLLIDATKPDGWREAIDVGSHLVDRHDPPVLVAVNRATTVPDALDRARAAVPIGGAGYVTCDVTDPASARDTLVELLGMLLDELDAAGEPSGTGELR